MHQHMQRNTERQYYAEFNQILEGWSKRQEKCLDGIKEFYTFHYEFSVIDGLVLKGTNRIIVPEMLRQNVLNKPHGSH